MMKLRALPSSLGRDSQGVAAIEVALVAPVLVLISLGSFQVSQIVARQAELQGAVQEAAAIAMASAPDDSTKRATMKSILMTSTELPTEKVTVTAYYRCGSQTTLHTGSDGCDGNKKSKYVKIALTDTYTPLWTKFGVGKPLTFNVNRYVMYEQED